MILRFIKAVLLLVGLLGCAGVNNETVCTCSNPNYSHDLVANVCRGPCQKGYQKAVRQETGAVACASCPVGLSLAIDGTCRGGPCPSGYLSEEGQCKEQCPRGYVAISLQERNGSSWDACAENCTTGSDHAVCLTASGGSMTRAMRERRATEGQSQEDPDIKEPPLEPPLCMCRGGVQHRVRGCDTLLKVAAKYGTSPYTLRKHNPQVQDPDPEAIIQGVQMLTVCPEDERFRRNAEPVNDCLDQYPRPCGRYRDQEQEDCFCAYQQEGDHKWPFSDNGGKCDLYITCKHWKSEGLKSCRQGQVARDHLFEGKNLSICTRALGPCTKEGCLDTTCFCRQFLLPPGTYPDPFDDARRVVFKCTEDITTDDATFECPDPAPHLDPAVQKCGPERKCKGQLTTYGGCTRTHIITMLSQVLRNPSSAQSPPPSMPLRPQAPTPRGPHRSQVPTPGPGSTPGAGRDLPAAVSSPAASTSVNRSPGPPEPTPLPSNELPPLSSNTTSSPPPSTPPRSSPTQPKASMAPVEETNATQPPDPSLTPSLPDGRRSLPGPLLGQPANNSVPEGRAVNVSPPTDMTPPTDQQVNITSTIQGSPTISAAPGQPVSEGTSINQSSAAPSPPPGGFTTTLMSPTNQTAATPPPEDPPPAMVSPSGPSTNVSSPSQPPTTTPEQSTNISITEEQNAAQSPDPEGSTNGTSPLGATVSPTPQAQQPSPTIVVVTPSTNTTSPTGASPSPTPLLSPSPSPSPTPDQPTNTTSPTAPSPSPTPLLSPSPSPSPTPDQPTNTTSPTAPSTSPTPLLSPSPSPSTTPDQPINTTSPTAPSPSPTSFSSPSPSPSPSMMSQTSSASPSPTLDQSSEANPSPSPLPPQSSDQARTPSPPPNQTTPGSASPSLEPPASLSWNSGTRTSSNSSPAQSYQSPRFTGYRRSLRQDARDISTSVSGTCRTETCCDPAKLRAGKEILQSRIADPDDARYTLMAHNPNVAPGCGCDMRFPCPEAGLKNCVAGFLQMVDQLRAEMAATTGK